MKRVFSTPLILITIALISSCADQIVESTPSIVDEEKVVIVAPKFTDIQNEIFNASCAYSGCHSGSVNPDHNQYPAG